MKAIHSYGLIHDDSPCIDVFDMDRFQAQLENIKTNLPDWTHGLAIKCCPLSGVLRQAMKQGFGTECASMGEVKHAISLGFEPSKIFYDSPVKTKESFLIVESLLQYSLEKCCVGI